MRVGGSKGKKLLKALPFEANTKYCYLLLISKAFESIGVMSSCSLIYVL
jgi:hypothetical protein